MKRAFDDDSDALRRGAQAVERAAERLERSAERLDEAGRDGRSKEDGRLERRLDAFEEGLAKGLTEVASTSFEGLKHGFDGLFSGLLGLFSKLFTSRLGLFGDLLGLVLPFAGGGFVKSPTLALLGEAGPEYVIPESHLTSALGGGLAGLAEMLAGLRGGGSSLSDGGSASLTRATTVQHFHYAPVIGSLDRLEDYSRVAEAGVKDY